MANDHGVAHAVSLARNTPGYEKLSRQQLMKWRKAIMKPTRRMGRPGSTDKFNVATLSFLMYGSIERLNDRNRVAVEADIAYSYDVIRLAANKAKALPLRLLMIRRYRGTSSPINGSEHGCGIHGFAGAALQRQQKSFRHLKKCNNTCWAYKGVWLISS